MKKTKGTEGLDFEKALAELEALVARMEKGDLPLEQALESFERGIELTRLCQSALKWRCSRTTSLTGLETCR